MSALLWALDRPRLTLALTVALALPAAVILTVRGVLRVLDETAGVEG